MHDLKSITPLGGTLAVVDEFEGLVIAECPDWALASIAARAGQSKKVVAGTVKLLGVTLPGIATSSVHKQITAFWIGPEQWMIEAPLDTHEDLPFQLKKALKDSASITEQSGGWVRFDITGRRCHDMLERLCNANTRAMLSASVTRVRLEHMGCFLMCRSTDSHFSVMGPRSSAASIHHALATAAKGML